MGLCTIGTGVKISNAPCTPQELARTYDIDELSATFHQRLHEAERCVGHYVRESKLTQSRYDSLTSFVFNVGVGRARKALGPANGGEHAKVAEEMSLYVDGTAKGKKGKAHEVKLAGLVARRVRGGTPLAPSNRRFVAPRPARRGRARRQAGITTRTTNPLSADP